MFVDFNILNQLGSPSINSNTFANRPAAGQTGRLFVSTDTFEIYRDNGTTWDLIGGPGSSTITGTGTATQVAYFTSSQAIGSSANLFWDNTNTRLGIGTATPGAALDIHSTGIMAHFNTTSATGNTYIAFQRTGTSVWRLGDQYNAGANFFQIHNIALSNNAIEIATATNKSIFTAVQTYTTGLARGNYFDYNLSVSAGGSFSSPNAITALGASLDLTLAGNATIPSGARSGLDAYNSIAFTGAGTLTHGQGTQIRAYSNITAGWAFNGSATGTVTHLAGLRALFPDNTGSAINVTNNYALLLNDQTPNTGTVTYTNRWGVYQEGASDLNYMAANLLLGSTTNSGEKLQVTGAAIFSSSVQATTMSIGISPQTDKLFVYNASGTNTGLTIQQDGSGDIFRANGNSGANRFSISQAGAATFSSTLTAGLITADNADIYAQNGTGTNLSIGFKQSSAVKYRLRYDIAGDTVSMVGSSGNFIQTWIQSGNIGIGTIAPNAKLSVSGSSDTPTGFGTFLVKNSSDVGISMGASSTSYVWLQGNYYGSGYNIPVVLQNAGGNVLIGTTTDAGQKLQVNGNAIIGGSGNPTLTINGTDAAYTGQLYINAAGAGSSKIIGNGGTNELNFETNNTLRLTVNSNGIKTAAPTTGTAAAWKLGSRVAAAVVLDATQYIELEVGGTLYKLAIVT